MEHGRESDRRRRLRGTPGSRDGDFPGNILTSHHVKGWHGASQLTLDGQKLTAIFDVPMGTLVRAFLKIPSTHDTQKTTPRIDIPLLNRSHSMHRREPKSILLIIPSNRSHRGQSRDCTSDIQVPRRCGIWRCGRRCGGSLYQVFQKNLPSASLQPQWN